MSEKEEYIVRKNLTKQTRAKKLIDMPYVYSQIDRGRPLQDIADELDVCRMTIYRRHKEYQTMVEAILKAEQKKEVETLPPLPVEM